MKKLIYVAVILLVFIITFHYREKILVYYKDLVSPKENVATTLVKNEYYRHYNFKYVSNTENFTPLNKQDILNIYYTIINSGMTEFSFYCSKDYLTCIDDVKDISKNEVIMSNINNFVHPYNGFKNVETEIDSLGKITVNINHNYTEEQKIILNYKIDEIIKNNINDSMDTKEKIRTIHDYIIEHTKYDQERSDNNVIKYNSDTAYGALIEGYALCGGYTDAMMLFLEKFNVKSYRISSEHHVWNYVDINNNWYNLDLTWDDPINPSGDETLEHTFFLITNKAMEKLDTNEHLFDKTVYSE